MKKAQVFLSAIVLTAGLVFAASTASAAEKFTWRMQSLHPAGSGAYNEFKDYFIPLVKKITNGRLIIKPFPANSIVKNRQGMDAISKGTFEAGQLGPAYWLGKDPGWVFIRNASAGFDTFWQYSAWLYEGGGMKLVRETYRKQGVYLIGFTLRPGEPLHFKGKIRSLKEFRKAGIKIRTPPGITTDLFKDMGASPLFLSPTELYTALDKGVVDAAEWTGLADNFNIGLHEVTDSFLFPSFHSPVGVDDVFVNLSTWNKLPDDMKAAVEIAVKDWGFHQWKTIFLGDIEAKKKMEAKGNVHVVWPEEDMKKIREMAQSIWKKWRDKSPMARKLFDSQVNFMKTIGLL